MNVLEPSSCNRTRLILIGGYVLYFVLHLLIFFHFGPQFIDDAYITFRYAERIASGRGFTFNDNLWVLGTTTPLWTLLVAVGRGAGIPLVIWLEILLSAAGASVSFCIWRIISSLRMPLFGFVGGFTILVYERWLFDFLMGMETLLYVTLVFALFLVILRKQWFLTGFLAALAILCRPDGAVIAAIALFALARISFRRSIRQTAVMLLTLFPWLLFCLILFHSFVPHSVQVKQWIHAASFSEAFLALWRQLFRDPFFVAVALFAFVGSAAIVFRWRTFWPLLVWPFFFALGLGSSHIKVDLFPWYSGPLIASLYLLALIGMAAIGRRIERLACRFGSSPVLLTLAKGLPILILLLILYRNSGFWQRNWRHFPPLVQKETQYLEASSRLGPQIQPNQKILLGEVGVFSYVFEQAEIIDSAGINSPAIYELRKKFPEDRGDGDTHVPPWVSDSIRSIAPDWIISLPQFLGMRAMLANHSLPPGYILVSGLPLSPQRVVVLKKEK